MVKIYKPTTSGRRGMSRVDLSMLTNQPPTKKLLKAKIRKAGRNRQGKLVVRHKGGGAKRKLRLIDRKREKFNIKAIVKTIEYDPNRSCFIALLFYADGEKRYILAPDKLKIGQELVSGDQAPLNIGNRLRLENIPVGSQIHEVETQPLKGGQIACAAGAYATMLAVEGKYANLKMPSGEVRKINKNCFATIGQLSNPEHNLVNYGKAGRKRWLGIRPTVRGTAMTPRDHPHGGGEGRSLTGLRKGPKTRWGKLAFGVKTRKRKNRSNKFIIKRRKTRNV